jgi:hypothetical protein
MLGHDVTLTIMVGTPTVYWVWGGGITGLDFGPEIYFPDGHSSSSSSVTPDKWRDRNLNQAMTTSFQTVASDTIQSEVATGCIAKQAQTITIWTIILLTKIKVSH